MFSLRVATGLDCRAANATPAVGLEEDARGLPPLEGVVEGRPLDRRRTGLDMATDILRHVALAVHSAETHRADAR